MTRFLLFHQTQDTTLRVSGDENLHLIERFTRVGNTLRYEFTIDDPTMWTKPWTAMIPLRRTNQRLFEFACHEGNESMGGILRGSHTGPAGRPGTRTAVTAPW